MRRSPVDLAGKCRLRFVFEGAVVSRDLTRNTTYGEIARALGKLSIRRYGHPVAIDVTLAALGGLAPESAARRPQRGAD